MVLLGLRLNGIEGSNDELTTWRDRFSYVLLLLLLVTMAFASNWRNK